MKLYIRAEDSRPTLYYRIDRRGSRDKDDHFGSTHIKDIIDKLKELGLPVELSEFNKDSTPSYITTEVLSTGTIVNTYQGWEVSKRTL